MTLEGLSDEDLLAALAEVSDGKSDATELVEEAMRRRLHIPPDRIPPGRYLIDRPIRT